MRRTLDTIVIGGSAGAFGSLKTLLKTLPEDLPAAVLVVLHTGIESRLRSHELLQPHASLPLRAAEDGMPLTPGQVLFAPPDQHLLLADDRVRLSRGPRENNFRPAIDPLFRSAAVHRSTRAAGIVLSGLLDDGAAGLAALSETGATCLVESPEGADYDSMPIAALKAVPGAEQHNPGALARRLTQITGEPVADAVPASEGVRLELMIASLERNSMETAEKLGTLSPLNCPDCNGVLWEIKVGQTRRFRCHTGHAYGEESLSAAQEEALERTLYDSLRAHRGRAELLRRMADDAENASSKERLSERADGCEQDAELIEDVLTRRRFSSSA